MSALLVAHLAEFDARTLYAPLGFPSLFVYCVRELGLSEQAAYKRIAAARAARKHPIVLEWLACGRVHLSAVAVLAPHLTADNVERLLSGAEGKTKYELERLVVSLAPRPDKRDVVRSLPEPERPAAPPEQGAIPCAAAPESPPPPPPRQRIEALSPERVHFGFTGSERLRGKLERVKQITWHTNPAGRLEVLVEALADFFLDRKDPGRKKRARARP